MLRQMKSKFTFLSSLVIIGLLITTVFFVSGYGEENMFSDVPSDHWAYPDIQYLAQRGIIEGLPSGKYAGEEDITRYQVASLVARTVRYLQNNPATTSQQDLSTLEDLVYKLSERVDSTNSTTSQLKNRVNDLEAQVQELRATSGRTEEYNQLAKKAENNFILGVTGIILGVGALAWAILM